ncbi:hypothetical protein RJT34_05036 [Clitoria ternatea]|uniref:Uncharacterized protein n=1 Tax=Clitoria ternatea TaxID=43366 RepID=A0AAN9PSR1_CLITE
MMWPLPKHIFNVITTRSNPPSEFRRRRRQVIHQRATERTHTRRRDTRRQDIHRPDIHRRDIHRRGIHPSQDILRRRTQRRGILRPTHLNTLSLRLRLLNKIHLALVAWKAVWLLYAAAAYWMRASEKNGSDRNVKVKFKVAEARNCKLEGMGEWKPGKSISSFTKLDGSKEDQLMWVHNPNGVYTVKTAYRVIQMLGNDVDSSPAAWTHMGWKKESGGMVDCLALNYLEPLDIEDQVQGGVEEGASDNVQGGGGLSDSEYISEELHSGCEDYLFEFFLRMAGSTDDESLLARIRQLEQERDELRKDIEQLCMQHSGPGYLAVATRMHFQRTAGLEQEIESLKKKLAAFTRDNLNLQEELSEAYRIKSQLADLHSAEVSKNMEAEKQLKFFQGCVASAFAERDQAIIEAEKVKEKEETMSQQINGIYKRVEELASDCHKLKELNDALQNDQAVHMQQNENFKKVINKFFQIRQHSSEEFADASWEEKCACLLGDREELWSFNDDSTSKYISALEEQLERLKNSMDYLQTKLRVGLEIENHLKKRVSLLEKKQISMGKVIENDIADLKHYHSKCRDHIMSVLSDGESSIKSLINVIDERVRRFDQSTASNLTPQRDEELEEHECRDVHISPQAKPVSEFKMNSPSSMPADAGGKGDLSDALSVALQEKVAALLLLSQQEERHLLERNVNSALQRKIDELQRNLLQVTNEKVKALMDFAQLKQEHQLLLEKLGHETEQGKGVVHSGERKLVIREKDGTLKTLLKKSYLRRWIGPLDNSGNEVDSSPNNEGKFFDQRSSNIDFARMKIENATLKESMESMEHLTSSIHRLRLSLLKAKESVTSEGTISGVSEILNGVISEAKLLRTALGSSLPISWSVETDFGSIGDSVGSIGHQECGNEKMDTVSAAGLEMVELLLFSAQILRDFQTKLVPDIEVL